MDISIIGTGYVGLTTGIALAELGNRVVLVDVIPEKLALIEEGRAPFYEPQVDDLSVVVLEQRAQRVGRRIGVLPEVLLRKREGLVTLYTEQSWQLFE